MLKTRLNLENFTGLTPEAIRQDIHASVFLTGLESILSEEAPTHLNNKTTQHPRQVNRMVSFNAIKHHAFELFDSDLPTDELFERLTPLFLSHPTCSRPHRKPPRKKRPPTQDIDHLRRRRKYCF